ncbi:hypothetical protein PFICI_07372 [Pestalotiopsis fici W106-1]|uniref:Rhodopsin domain-containing protein n=1 Tax=Pestalotiopsis fici (strain W106-1 / CGMCC3.15140) TaxID=1229662 RepID=W3X140_PESFW|nr:uncharacterized protein PFICI_07372 [Pestalotiopsis fici W106-1]ETS79843.1 hypothetical protein PFICI_07372 [Pestalotiopsis fici W106-1]
MMVEDRGIQLEAVVIALLALCWLSVTLRCYTMGFLLRRFYPEDWLAIITLFLYSAYSAFCLLGVHYGLGAHVEDVPIDERPKALFYKWAGQVSYVVIAMLVKFIVGLLLLRLCVGKKWQCITLWTLLVVSGIYTVFYVFMVVYQCQPVPFYWYRYDPNPPITGNCNGTALAIIPTYISFIISVVSDWILALLPISIVWNAKMDRRSKISVACVLALGSIASMATVVRIPYAKQLLSDPDYLYNFTDLAIWSTVEIGLGLMASSLATLKPLFRKLKILVVTKSSTLPYHHSRPGHSRARSGSIFHGKNKEIKKLQKSPTIAHPALSGWKALHDKPAAPQEAPYELSLAAETSSVRTTITANHPSLDGGSGGASRPSPPPPTYQDSYRRTSVSYQFSHVDPRQLDHGGMF